MNSKENFIDWDLGEHPVYHHFLKSIDQVGTQHPLVLSQDQTSGMIQIRNPFPIDELIPKFSWLTETEAKDYMGPWVEKIKGLPGITSESKIVGLTQRDAPMVRLLEEQGFTNVSCISRAELGIHDDSPGVERSQQALSSLLDKQVLDKYKNADVLLVNRILHHVNERKGFFQNIQSLIKPEGYLLFEVPDCTIGLDDLDYTLIYEQHVIYFTEETFQYYLASQGIKILDYEMFHRPVEASLIAIAKMDSHAPRPMKPEILTRELERFHHYQHQFAQQKSKLRAYLEDYNQREGKVALFGAGHYGVTFLHLFELNGLVDFVSDDNPNKKDLYMPGSLIPIFPSDRLIEREIKLCMLSVSPLNEEKIIVNNPQYVEAGGNFVSVFPASSRALVCFKS